MNKENECGLWEKESRAGTKYHSGKITIDGTNYYANVFKNNSENEKAPSMNLVLRKIEELTNNENKEEEDKSDPFKDFGNEVQLTDEDLPF